MPEITKRASFYAGNRSPRVKTFHIETDGAVVNITVGLADEQGRQVTRVDVLPDDETRGGMWRQDGARIIRDNPDDECAQCGGPRSSNRHRGYVDGHAFVEGTQR